MAASLSLASTGVVSGAVSSSSTSFFSQSKRSTALCKPSSLRSLGLGRVGFFSSAAGEWRGCRASNATAKLEAPPAAETTLYGLLGLEVGVPLNDIKTSYRRLALLYHPDVCSPENREECTKMFLQVQDAYEVLSDPLRRSKYDYQLMNPLCPSSIGWGSMVKRSKESEIEWQSAWREQLSRLAGKERQAHTWAAKMRSKNAVASH